MTKTTLTDRKEHWTRRDASNEPKEQCQMLDSYN